MNILFTIHPLHPYFIHPSSFFLILCMICIKVWLIFRLLDDDIGLATLHFGEVSIEIFHSFFELKRENVFYISHIFICQVGPSFFIFIYISLLLQQYVTLITCWDNCVMCDAFYRSVTRSVSS